MTEKILRIKGVADFSSVVSEAKTVTQVLEQTMGKKRIELIDPKALDFVTKQGKRALDDLSSVLEDLRKEAEGFDQALQDTQKSEQELGRLVEKRLDNLRKQAEAQKQIIRIKDTGEAPEKPTGLQTIPSQRAQSNGARRFGGRITDALGQAAGMAPGGAGQAAGVLSGTARGAQQGAAAGGSLLGSIGLGLLGGALAGGVGMLGMGLARSNTGFDSYKQRIPALTQLQAMGTDQVSGVGRSTATSLGYGPGETDALQVALRRSMGGNLSSAQENNRLASTMNFSRALALDPSEVAGAAGAMRGAGGTDFASTQTARILSDAFRSGMDRSQASTFLATMSQGIAEMSNDGTANTNALLSFATRLTKGGASPEQALRRFSGVNDAIANSQGVDNAFFQMAAARGGLGGGSLLGAQLATRQGLQDMNLYGSGGVLSQIESPDLQRQAMNAFGGEGGLASGDFTKRMSQGILDQLGGQGFDRENKDQFQGMISQIMDRFQVKDAGQATLVLDTLERLAKGGPATKDDRERLKSLSESPQERMNSELVSTLKDLKTASVEARAAYASVDLGKQVAPFFNKFTESMTTFDEALTKMLGTDSGKALGEGITSMLKAPIDLLTSAVNGLNDFMQSIKDLTVGDILLKGVTEMADALWTSLKAVFGLVMDSATEALRPVLAVGKGLMDAGGAIMSGNFGGVKDAFMGGYKSISGQDSLGWTKSAFQDKADRDAKGGSGITVNGMSLEEAQRTIPRTRAEAVEAYVEKAEKAGPGERAEMARRRTGESDPIKAEELFRQMLQEMKTMNRKMTPGGAVLKPATKPAR